MPFYLPSTYKPPKQDYSDWLPPTGQVNPWGSFGQPVEPPKPSPIQPSPGKNPIRYQKINDTLYRVYYEDGTSALVPGQAPVEQPQTEYSGPSMSPATEDYQTPTQKPQIHDPDKVSGWGTPVLPTGFSQFGGNVVEGVKELTAPAMTNQEWGMPRYQRGLERAAGSVLLSPFPPYGKDPREKWRDAPIPGFVKFGAETILDPLTWMGINVAKAPLMATAGALGRGAETAAQRAARNVRTLNLAPEAGLAKLGGEGGEEVVKITPIIKDDAVKQIYNELINELPPSIVKDLNIRRIQLGKFQFEGGGGNTQIISDIKQPLLVDIALETGEQNLKKTLRHEMLHAYVLKHRELNLGGYFGYEDAVHKLGRDIDAGIFRGTEEVVEQAIKKVSDVIDLNKVQAKLSPYRNARGGPGYFVEREFASLEKAGYDTSKSWEILQKFNNVKGAEYATAKEAKAVRDKLWNEFIDSIPSINKVKGVTGVEQATKKPITMAGTAPDVSTTTFRKGKEYAGNLRLERFSEDVQDTLRNVVASDPDKLTEVGRGVRTWKQTEDKAREILQYVGGDENKLIKKIGQAYNAEEIEALSMATQRKFDEVLNLQKLIQGGANTDENLVKLALLQKEFESLSKNITFGLSGATSEAGRTLNILKKQIGKMESMSPDTQKWRNLIRQLGGRKGIEKFSDSLALLDINNKAQVANFLRTVNQLSWKKIQNYPSLLRIIVYNSMLSSPRTQLINLGSTMLHSGIAMTAEREAAALMESLLRGAAKVTGRTVPEQQRFYGEGLAELMSLRNGIKQGTRDMIDTIRYGVSPEQLSKYEIRARLPGKVGRVLEIPSTGMAAGDAFFYGLGHTGALEAELYRLARRAGFNPLKDSKKFAEKMADLRLNPPESLLNNAAKEAERRLFRGEPGQATAAIMKAREKIPGSFLILPFIRTPAALIKRGAELSPLQILNPHLWKHLIKKSPEAADELAKLAIGTALTTSIYFYVRDGKITGPPPQNAAARDRFYREGKQPYSLKIGDKWLGYQPLEPLNLPLSMVAAVVNALDEGDDKTAGEKAWQAVDSMGRNILSQTYISGLGNVFDAIENPESQGGRVIARMLTSFIPFSSALRTTSQIVDPTVRDIEPWDIASSIKSQIPGLTGQVPARVDVFGDTPERQGAQWSPYRTSEVVDDPLTQELERLELNIGFVGDTIGGQKLDPEEQRQYQEMAGKAVEGALIQAMFKPSYASLPDLEKKRVLQRAADAAKADIRRQLEPIFAPAFAR